MKNQKIEKMLIKADVSELTDDQLGTTYGGILPAILAALSIYAGICAVAYGAGALHGMACKR